MTEVAKLSVARPSRKAIKLSYMKIKIIAVLTLLFFSILSFCQLPNDLSKIRAASITDEQLRTFLNEAQKAGLTENDISTEVRRRGMPESEIMELRTRINALLSAGPMTKSDTGMSSSKGRGKAPAIVAPPVQSITDPSVKVFGSELFSGSAITFEPDLRIATPSNYRLGPDDQLIIDVFGVNQSQQTQTISPEGSINLKYIGPLYLNGLTIEEARTKITSRLASIYPAIRGGGTKVQIALGAIRSIRVTIIGAVSKPGTYTLPSLATLFNALYTSGGPDAYGSFRTIELLRNNQVYQVVDMYRFLLYGDQSNDVRLQDKDVIRIPLAKVRVQVTGEVKRVGVFEVLPGEALDKVINDFSGGYQRTAFTAIIKAQRITETERRLIDISGDSLASFIPKNGDEFAIQQILQRYENAVSVSGAVFRPGIYALTTGMKLSDLIKKASGLVENAYLDRALLFRLKPDLSKEILSVNLKSILASPQNDILLRKDDELVVSSLQELSTEYTVSISGAVRKQGSYLYRENLTLKDAILQAGGLTDEASIENIEVARRRTNVDPNNPFALLSDVVGFALDTIELSVNQQDFKLAPYDIISVKSDPFKRAQEQVTISGQVLYPGPYAILARQERLSSIIRRAGSPLIEANIRGAKLRRFRKEALNNEETVEKISKQVKDSTGLLVNAAARLVDEISLNLESALANPGGESDIYVQGGDEIIIPRKDEMVQIEGEVLHPVKMSYERGKNLRHYINSAGGFVSSANKNKVFVVYANGKAARTKKFLFFRNYPEIEEGAQIFVPKYSEEVKVRKSAAEVMATVSALATMSYLIVYLVNQIK